GVALAKRILGVEEVHVGACGLGDASKIVSADGRLQQQVHWHADGGPEVQQVSFRTALDRHDPTNAPLRVLPGSHVRERDEVMEELRQVELATGRHDTMPDHLFAQHPHEMEVVLDPRWTLVWTPSCWHATGVKTGAGPRRAMAWNYYPPGGRTRDVEALKYVFGERWEGWTADRKQLWGLL
ncbi:MAG: phytanoyl-CoA dioxygenase family protein, partial [bacterium]|nr:phytanoyl-CoA dioxygenase family protein [bacterium]